MIDHQLRQRASPQLRTDRATAMWNIRKMIHKTG
jgi:hypothetical protein